MSPKVYPDQQLRNGNGTFLIDGPTGSWASNELAAVVTFVVKQPVNGNLAVGIGETALLMRPRNGGSFDWSAGVTHISGPAFQAGAANVQAWASIAESGGPDKYDWDVDITINS